MLDSDDDDVPADITDVTDRQIITTGSSTIEKDSDNTVEMNRVIYRLYSLAPSSNGTSFSPSNEELASLRAFAFTLTKDYLWHNEQFRLFYSGSDHCYYGSTNYGDNMDDEWFIVYILYELSKRFPHLLIRVTDSDGQFLLIEAADVLQKKLLRLLEEQEEMANNRVFIFRGALYIVQFSNNSLPPSYSIDSLDELLIHDPGRLFTILLEHSLLDKYRADQNVQRVINKRIGVYPKLITSQRHRVNCFLPAKLAAVIQQTGSFFLPAAVHLFCQNCDNKNENKESSLHFTSGDLITSSVTFPKNLYAKLVACNRVPKSQSFWRLPNKDEFGSKANELGMKLMNGFEILYSRGRGGNGAPNRDSTLHDEYIKSLNSFGYFEDTPADSKDHERMMAMAKLNYVLQDRKVEENDYQSSMSRLFPWTYNNVKDTDIDAIRRERPGIEDDDDWLTVTPDVLDTLLASKKAFSMSAAPVSSLATNSAVSSQNGGHLNGLDVVPKPRSITKDKKSAGLANPRPTAKGIDSDPDGFADSIKKMLELEIPDDGDDSSDMDSYGDETELDLDENGEGSANAISKDLNQYMDLLKGCVSSMDKQEGTSGNSSKYHLEPCSAGCVGKTSQKPTHSPGGDSVDLENDDFTPVKIDKKMLSEMLESYFP